MSSLYQCWVQGLRCKDKERTRTKVQGQGKDKDKDKDLRARTKDGSVRIRKGPRTNKKLDILFILLNPE